MRIPGAHKNAITGLAFADANRVLSCGIDKFVRLWDVAEVDQLQQQASMFDDEEYGSMRLNAVNPTKRKTEVRNK